MNIYLVRHGEYNNPKKIIPCRLPVELSRKGIEDITKIRRYFEGHKISKIYSSRVKRCMQTSEIISNGKIPIIYDLRIIEVLSAYQGFDLQKNDDPWTTLYMDTQTLGGETQRDVYKRVKNFWEEKIADEKDDFAVCSHGDPLNILYQFLLGHEEKEFIGNPIWNSDMYQRKGSLRMIKLEDKKVVDILDINI